MTAPLGELGAVVRKGTGTRDVILIPGWGFGAEVFDSFMRANVSRYRMVAVTLPGFGATAGPPMPPDAAAATRTNGRLRLDSAVASLPALFPERTYS